MRQQMIIRDERAAAAFASAPTRAMIFELMKGERSLSELRGALGMSLSLLHYHIGRLQQLGLITVSAVKRRSGRPIKTYRVVATEFRVPGSVARRSAGTGLKDELDLAIEQAELRHPTDTAYFLDEQGTPRMRRSQSAPGTAAHQRWWRLRVTAREAAELTREVSDLMAKYNGADAPVGQSHICYFALVKTQSR
jgi:DNA-binding transcriptional ArsR family regulator